MVAKGDCEVPGVPVEKGGMDRRETQTKISGVPLNFDLDSRGKSRNTG